MMDEIIIDGVNVNKCKYFECCSKECTAEYYVRYGYEITEFDSCSDNYNCYYKQVLRTKQKLDKVKKVCNKFTPEHYKILLIINDGIVEE